MRIALAQVTSTDDPTTNAATIKEWATQAQAQGAEVVVFPEAMMRAFGGSPLAQIAEPVDGPWARAVEATARTLGVTIIAGMFTPGQGGRVRNTLLVTGPGGTSTYDKLHLFDAFGYAESDVVQGGQAVVVVDVAGTTVGLATCYDIRFPDLFTSLAQRGARVVVVPASWGSGPGKVEQWELLARARALDSTTAIVAVGQPDPASRGAVSTGPAPTGIGHSLVISPLGEMLHRLGEAEELLVVDLDTGASVDQARQLLPVLANRRTDLGG